MGEGMSVDALQTIAIITLSIGMLVTQGSIGSIMKILKAKR